MGNEHPTKRSLWRNPYWIAFVLAWWGLAGFIVGAKVAQC